MTVSVLVPGGPLVEKGEFEMLTRVAKLTSSQIADRIVETDLAAHVDGLDYYDRLLTRADRSISELPYAGGDMSLRGQVYDPAN
jgi:hypothetical protein